jgi:hypothetical protein
MTHFIVLIGLLFSTVALGEERFTPSLDITMNTEPVSASMSLVEQKVRTATVKVVKPGARAGHGSGSMVTYKGLPLIFTAQHVADGMLGSTYYAMKNGEIKEAILIYSDSLHDISILYLLEEFDQIKPLKYSPRKEILGVGEETTYSAYPSDHKLMTFRGRVAGYEVLEDAGIQILLHTHGWFGCSGSLVYDSAGDVVGILWGLDVEYLPNGAPQAIDNLMWVAPIQNLNMELALTPFCEVKKTKHRACR